MSSNSALLVRACLEDDADDTDGAGDAAHTQPFVELAVEQHGADGVGQLDEVVDASADVVELVLVELEALDDGGCNAAFLGGRKVSLVGFEDSSCVGGERFLDRGARRIARLSGRCCNLGAREFHFTRDFGDFDRCVRLV